ncbi:MAG: tetratricopeptide repeat protein [Planctomycetes bacterium]|nr:tetratricopeptide repeat protein [Planctomycetota bacterium]
MTERCNLACPGCYLPERSGPGASVQEIEETVFKPLSHAGIRSATLTGGEPLLHPECLAICAAATRHLNSVQVVTNGMLLDLDTYKGLRDVGIKAVKVSLDAPNAAAHDLLRGKDGCFAKVTGHLRAIGALSAGQRGEIDLGCICTVHPNNVHLLAETADFVLEMGLDSMLFQPFHPYGQLYPIKSPSGRSPQADQHFLAVLDEQLERLRQLRQLRPGFIDNSLAMLDRFREFYTQPLGPRQVCGADRFVFVNSEFQVRGCLFCGPLTSLREQSWLDFLEGPTRQEFDTFRVTCRRCLMGCQFVDQAQDLVEEGFRLLAADRPDDALKIFDASLNIEYSVAAEHGAGVARSRLGELEQGLELLRSALTHRPRNLFILGDIGWSLLQQGRLDELDTITGIMLELASKHGMAHRLRGLAARNRGDVRAALPLLRIGMENSPSGDPWAAFEYGLACMDVGQFEELEIVVNRLKDQPSGKGLGHRLQGLAARNRGDVRAALPLLRIGMENSPSSDPWPIFEYGLVCLEAEQYLEAEQNIRKAVALLPSFPWFHYRLALALQGMGKFNEAQSACREALRLEPGQEKFLALMQDLEEGKSKKPTNPLPAIQPE